MVHPKDKWGSTLSTSERDLCSETDSWKIQRDRVILEQCEVYLSVAPSLEEKGFEVRQLQAEEHPEMSDTLEGRVGKTLPESQKAQPCGPPQANNSGLKSGHRIKCLPFVLFRSCWRSILGLVPCMLGKGLCC